MQKLSGWIVVIVAATALLAGGCGTLPRISDAIVGPAPAEAEVTSLMTELGLKAEDYGVIVVSQGYQDETPSGSMDKLTDTAKIVGPLVAAPNWIGATVSGIGLLTDNRHDIARLQRRDKTGQTVTLVRKDNLQSMTVGLQGTGDYPLDDGGIQKGTWNEGSYFTFYEDETPDVVLKLLLGGAATVDPALKETIGKIIAEAAAKQPSPAPAVAVPSPTPIAP